MGRMVRPIAWPVHPGDPHRSPMSSRASAVVVHPHPSPAVMEPVEARRMLSVSLSSGVLSVRGTAAADRIIVTASGANLTVNDNGRTYSFLSSAVQQIRLAGYAGNDVMGLSAGVTQSASID